MRKLKPFLGKKADGLWIRYSFADWKEKQEWLQVIHMLAQKYKIDPVTETIVLPPPERESAGGDIRIGRVKYLDQAEYDFGLLLSEMARHVGIFGSTGSGKTNLAKNTLRELIKKKTPFIVFDWERSYRDLAREYPEVKVFTIGADTAPLFFNFFKSPEGIPYREYIKNVIEVFNRAYLGGVGSDSVLLKVFDQAYKNHEIPTIEDARQILEGEMGGKKMKGREMLWKQSSLRMLQFLSYGGTGKLYNVTEFYPIEKLLGDFVVFELGALASSNDKRFFIEIFTLWYWLYMERQGIEHESLKHVLLFEEFHNIVENSKHDDLIQKIFRQIRKYGTGLMVIDQTPSLIPNAIFENLYTKISFSLSHQKNIMAVASAMYMDRDQMKFIGLLQTGQAICRLMGRYPYPFLLTIPFHDSGLKTSDNELKKHMKDFYLNYRPENPPEAEIRPLHVPTNRFTPSPLARIFLEDLLLHPFDGADKRRKRLGLSPRDAVELQDSLIQNGLIAAVHIERKKLFELTGEGEIQAHKLGLKISKEKNQGLEHRYYLDQIKQQYLKNGWFTFKEKSDIDLVLEKDDQVVALEIETGKNKPEQTQKNIMKLIKFTANSKLILATNEVALAKSKTLLADTRLSGANDIKVVLARDYLKSSKK